jgi:hypothetical protein
MLICDMALGLNIVPSGTLIHEVLENGPLTVAQITRRYNASSVERTRRLFTQEPATALGIEWTLAWGADRHDEFERVGDRWQSTPKSRWLNVYGRPQFPDLVTDNTEDTAAPKAEKPAQRAKKDGSRPSGGMLGVEGLLKAAVPEPGRSRRNKQRNKVCVICNTAFKGRADAQTCSPRCRQALSRKNRRAEPSPHSRTQILPAQKRSSDNPA